MPDPVRLQAIIAAFVCLAAASIAGAATADEPKLGALKGCDTLQEKAADSTFVLYLPGEDRWGACNPERAGTRFLPASTYKVPHALIGLETGVIRDENAKVKWDGVKRAIPAWNADTSLATGMRNSTVWFYQKMARSIGPERMAEWLRKLDYGNMDIGKPAEIDSFWLTGALRISPVEEVRFLDRLRREELPASRANQQKVKHMMILDHAKDGAKDSWIMHGKTGAVLPISGDRGDLVSGDKGAKLVEGLDQIGWFVGWIERPGDPRGDAVFALNLALDFPGALGMRKQLVHDMLVANGVLPASVDKVQ